MTGDHEKHNDTREPPVLRYKSTLIVGFKDGIAYKVFGEQLKFVCQIIPRVVRVFLTNKYRNKGTTTKTHEQRKTTQN